MCTLLLCMEVLRATHLRSMRGEMDRARDLRCMLWSNSDMESRLQLIGRPRTRWLKTPPSDTRLLSLRGGMGLREESSEMARGFFTLGFILGTVRKFGEVWRLRLDLLTF